MKSILYLAVLLCLGCTRAKDPLDKNGGEFKELIDLKTVSPLSSVSVSTPDELFICDKELRTWYGGIQGLTDGQIKKIYVFGQCQSNENSFDIIWVNSEFHSNQKEYTVDDLSSRFKKKGFQKNYTKDGFFSYFFKIHLIEVNDPILDDPYEFPCAVDVYYNTGNDEKLLRIGVFDVETWEDYVQLQYNCIF